MIHDATGKFSSRWVFPDRNSLALVIRETCYIGPKSGRRRSFTHATGSRAPYRGIRRQNQCYLGYQAMPPRRPTTPETGLARRLTEVNVALLPVVLQHLVAGRRNLGAILLQAGQDGEIALID